MKGLLKIKPSHKDYHFLKTFGATGFDTSTLPADFSIYDGRPIPNQNIQDTRFTPPVRPLPYGCTAESQTLLGGLEDTQTYPPDDLYDNTPPHIDGQGRDMRVSLQETIDHGYKLSDGTIGNKRLAYFNVYSAGAIDDFDAVRIALYINQTEKRAVTVGTYWYPEFENPTNGILPLPSFNTSKADLHNHVITGWKTINGVLYFEDISHQGMEYGVQGIDYISRPIFNALINQPYTGMFTLTETQGQQVITVGMQAYIDHLVAFVRQLFNLNVSGSIPSPVYLAAKAAMGTHMTLDNSTPATEGCAEALSAVLVNAGIKGLPSTGIPGTDTLLQWLETNATEIFTPEEGSVIIAATEGTNAGHCGVVMQYGICSNNSFSNSTGAIGTWTENYSLAGFQNYFGDVKGLEVRFFRCE